MYSSSVVTVVEIGTKTAVFLAISNCIETVVLGSSSGTGNSWTHECQHPGVLGTNRKAFDQGDDGQRTPVKRRSYSSACRSPSSASTRHAYSGHVRNFQAHVITIPDIISVV